MANEPKPFASLSSGLLARKGAARPAMRPQGFSQASAGLEDLGWNDMGFEPPKAAEPLRDVTHDAFGEEVEPQAVRHRSGLTPVQSPVHNQQAELADRLGVDEDADEEFDETAELYDPTQSLEADESEEDDEPEESCDAEEPFELEERYEAEDASEPPQAYEATPDPRQAYETAPEPPPIAEQVASPVHTPVPDQQAVAPWRSAEPRSAPGGKAKAAFTLRLDPNRHLKLRLACAVNGRSAQQIVTDALDRILTEMPELDAMAQKAKPKG